jgi:hypothetical protein
MQQSLSRSVSLVRLSIAATLAGAALSGCYVVPLNQATPNQPQAYAVAPIAAAPASSTPALTPPPPTSETFSARLYPSNQDAARFGMVNAIVTSDLNGRGHLSAQIGGEQFQGDATRERNSRNGIANAAGNRGGMLMCKYTMNSATLGSGLCVLNNGPAFTIHIGG